MGRTGASRCLQVDKILREAPNGTRIYVPIRNAAKMSYEERFWTKVLCVQPSLVLLNMMFDIPPSKHAMHMLDASNPGRPPIVY